VADVAEKVWPEIPNRVTPMVTELNEFFWTGGADGILRMLACEDCGRIIHPPSPRCPYCLSARVSPRELSGRGEVLTYTINYQQWVPDQEPYVIAVVALEEDDSVRLTTNIVCCEPEAVSIGMPVEVQFVEWDGLHLPCFRPAPGAPA
jgi:uncharacterized OB-fold protein